MSVQQGGEPKASTVPTSAANSGDVWMHIMTFVEPADIISLRKTCSTFREVSEHRGIWITAAKRVCADHGLFSGAFPFLTMSRLELEQLALGPTRFASIINEPIKEDLKGRPPARTRTFYPKVQPGGETLHIDSLRLLPGGRYLLTWTRSVGLFIWDLGFNASASLPMLPLARLSSKACFYLDQATPTPDRQGVRVRCIVRLASGDKLVVYEIRPVSGEPAFRQVRAWKLPKERADKVSQSSQYIAVSQYLKETVTIYSIDATDSSRSCRRVKVPGGVSSSMAIVGNTLVVPTRQKVHTLKLDLDKDEQLPKKSVARREDLRHSDSEVLHSSDWVEHSQRHTLCELRPLYGVTETQATTGMVLWNVEGLPEAPEASLAVYRGSTAEGRNITGEKRQLVKLKHGNVLQQSPTHFFVIGRKTMAMDDFGDPWPEDQIMVMKYPLHVDPVLAQHDSYDWDHQFPKPDVLMLTAHGKYPERNVSLDQIDVCCASGRLVVAPPVGFDAAAEKAAEEAARQERRHRRRHRYNEDGFDISDSEGEDDYGEDSDDYLDDPEYQYEYANTFIGGYGPSEIRIVDFLTTIVEEGN